MMDLPTGFIVLGSSTLGLIVLFALAYEMVRTRDDVKKVIEALQKEANTIEVKVRKPDLVQINRLIKISYKILKSPQHKEAHKDQLHELIKTMIDIKKGLSPMDWVHAERNDMRALVHLKEDSLERLKGMQQYYKMKH